MDFHEEEDNITRSSRSQRFSKIDALNKFAIFIGTVLESLFNKVAGLRLQIYSKETPRQVFSCVHIVKILSKYFFYRTPLVAAFLILFLNYREITDRYNPKIIEINNFKLMIHIYNPL